MRGEGRCKVWTFVAGLRCCRIEARRIFQLEMFGFWRMNSANGRALWHVLLLPSLAGGDEPVGYIRAQRE